MNRIKLRKSDPDLAVLLARSFVFSFIGLLTLSVFFAAMAEISPALGVSFQRIFIDVIFFPMFPLLVVFVILIMIEVRQKRFDDTPHLKGPVCLMISAFIFLGIGLSFLFVGSEPKDFYAFVYMLSSILFFSTGLRSFARRLRSFVIGTPVDDDSLK